MSGESDIAAIITAETDDFSGPIIQAEKDAETFFNSIVENGQRALSAMGSALAQLAVDVAQETKAVLLEVAHDYGVVALKTAILGTAVTATSSYFAGFWTTLRVGLAILGYFVPVAGQVGLAITAVTASVWAFNAANEYTNGELAKSFGSFTKTAEAWSEFKDSIITSSDALGIAGDDLGSVGSQMLVIAANATGISSAVEAADKGVSTVINSWTSGIEFLNQKWIEGRDIISDWATSAGAGAQSLREQAAASEALIAKQQEQAEFFGQLRGMQEGAAAMAAHSAEVQRIGSIETVGAIDLEINALQNRAAQMRLNGEVGEEEAKRLGGLFLALENQRQKIESGGMNKPHKDTAAESAIAQAEQAVRRLALGQDEAAVATLIASGATQQEIDRLRELQEEINSLKAAEDAEKEAKKALADAAKKAADEQAAAFKKQIDSTVQQAKTTAQLSDEIAVLNGEMTKREAREAQLFREGKSGKEAAEIAGLEEERDRLAKRKDTPGSLKAAFAGSSEAASILLKGVGGGNKMEQLAQQQVNVQQQILIATRENKSEPMQALTLGTA